MALKISEKGWVVIPADLRRKYGLKPGDAVEIVDYGGSLALVPASKDAVKTGHGMLRGKSLTKALLRSRAPPNASVSAEAASYIFDSYAVLAYFGREAGSSQVMEILRQGKRGDAELFLPLINLGEIAYIVEREQGVENAQRALAWVRQSPIRILPIDEQVVLDAAHIKAHHPISYADSFVVAAALEHDAAILTGDPEIAKLHKQVRVEFLK